MEDRVSIMGAKKGTCLVLIPTKGFQEVWDLAIKPAITNVELEPIRIDHGLAGVEVILSLRYELYEAKILIADVSSANANVTYELGMAHAIAKRTIIIAKEGSDIPFDLRGIRCLTYNQSNLEAFCPILRGHLLANMELGPVTKEEQIFPELEMITPELKEELNYLRKKTKEIKICVKPPVADIFFNDQLLGSSPQTILVNPDYSGNTISASYLLHLEQHRVLSQEDINNGSVSLTLEEMVKPHDKLEEAKAPEYIKWRYKHIRNPAVMRALSHYFLYAGFVKEAAAEAEELVKAAPQWYLAHNQAGHVANTHADYEEALRCFNLVVAMKPNSPIGYYNLACVSSIIGDFQNCLRYMKELCNSPQRLEIYGYLPFNMVEVDDNFDNIRNDKSSKKEFKSLELKLKNSWKSHKYRK